MTENPGDKKTKISSVSLDHKLLSALENKTESSLRLEFFLCTVTVLQVKLI